MHQSDYPPDFLVERTKNRQLAIWWPEPLHHRLLNLIEVANRTGIKTSQHELIGAIMLGAPASAPQLERLLKRYRRAVVKDCSADLDGEPNSKVLPIRRTRKSTTR